jgi:hypothetical protein
MDDDLLSALTEYERLYSAHPLHAKNFYVPSRFTRNDPGALIPLTDGEGLAQYSRALEALSIQSTVSLLPPWWQLDSLACVSHEKHGIPHATTQPDNISVALELIHQLTPQLILTDIDGGYTLAQALHTKHVALPPYWYIIEPYHTHRVFTLPGTTILHEWHLVPGVPVLYQCPHDTSHTHLGGSVTRKGSRLNMQHPQGTLDMPLASLPYLLEEHTCNSRV